MASDTKWDKSTPDAQWQLKLTKDQYRVLRQKGTEYPGTGQYNKVFEKGIYRCAACDHPLYSYTTKFNSGCGWPAFYDALPGALDTKVDADGHRVEILCKNCGGHLGHVFKGEGFDTPTDTRHCVNSVSIRLDKAIDPDALERQLKDSQGGGPNL